MYYFCSMNKRSILNKINILKDALMGNIVKIKVFYDIHIRKAISLSDHSEPSVIISLTSYGCRVRNSVVYTVYSLLKQSLRPACVVLWLDQNEYNNDNLPSDLLFLRSYGLEVRFCKDIRSYTKIIPSLSAFPNKHIITADDDLYYTKSFVREFIDTHHQYPNSIITAWAKLPISKGNGQLASYSEWPELKNVTKDYQYSVLKIMPLGVGGVLYPSNIFDDEVLNESVFSSLCPKADDIWLYLMGLRCGASKRLLVDSQISYYQTDTLRQYLTKDRLTESNRLGGENDSQLKALMEYYSISCKMLV